MASKEHTKEAELSIRERNDSTGSTGSSTSVRTPRTARFAEATSVNSPVEPPTGKRMPFSDRTSHYKPQAQVADVGFGYIGSHESQSSPDPGVEMPATPRSPLKSALRTPGAPPRAFDNPLSPTFREEETLEKEEKLTTKQQKKDLETKIRVRMAKFVLRGTNFSCSLIVLAMLTSTFTIFNATKNLPPRNNLPAWAVNTQTWPQITLLVIAAFSLLFSLIIFYGYWRGGHKRAERVAVYYNVFAVGFFMFSIIMWGIGAGVLQGSRANGNSQDIWGWSCKDNARKQIFENEVSYDLVCRMQNWSLLCAIIEIVVELITILIYSIGFYRYYSKRRLRKSMANRDAARSDLYLAQLRSQSMPATPAPYSPRDGGYNPMFSPRYAGMASEKHQTSVNVDSAAEEGFATGVRYIDASQTSPKAPFVLKAPPVKGSTPKSKSSATFDETQPTTPPTHYSVPSSPRPMTPRTPRLESQPVHQPAAPGEQQYESVPIPGAYTSPIQSPMYGAAHPSTGYFAPMR